jgi:hypothetical protein
MAYQIGEDILGANMTVKHMITDGDTTSTSGMADALNKPVTRQADVVHRAQNIFNQGQKAGFGKEMFPNTHNMSIADKKKVFAMDIKNRSSLVMQSLFSKYNGDIKNISEKLARTVDAIIHCYSGDCSKCRYLVTGCTGGKKHSWWRKSIHLGTLKWGPGSLDMTPQDKLYLRSLLEMKLSVNAIQEMKFNETSNPCEAFNRSLSARLAKNNTYPRNAEGRAHATVHSINNGMGRSLITKVNHLGVPIGPNAVRTLKQIEDKYKNAIEHKKNKYNKIKSIEHRRQQIQEYFKKKEKTTDTTDAYKKRREEPKLQLAPPVDNSMSTHPPHAAVGPSRTKKREDHSYSRKEKSGATSSRPTAAPKRAPTITR